MTPGYHSRHQHDLILTWCRLARKSQRFAYLGRDRLYLHSSKRDFSSSDVNRAVRVRIFFIDFLLSTRFSEWNALSYACMSEKMRRRRSDDIYFFAQRRESRSFSFFCSAESRTSQGGSLTDGTNCVRWYFVYEFDIYTSRTSPLSHDESEFSTTSSLLSSYMSTYFIS